MLHSQVRGDRVKNSIFFKLPGRMSLFTLKVLTPILPTLTAPDLSTNSTAVTHMCCITYTLQEVTQVWHK